MVDDTTRLTPSILWFFSLYTAGLVAPRRAIPRLEKGEALLLLGRLARGRRAHAARRVAGEDVRGHLALVIALLNLGPAGDLTRLVELHGTHLTHAAFRLFCLVRFLLCERLG